MGGGGAARGGGFFKQKTAYEMVERSRGLGDVYKRQVIDKFNLIKFKLVLLTPNIRQSVRNSHLNCDLSVL